MFKEVAYLVASCLLAILLRQLLEFRKAVNAIKTLPGRRILLAPDSIANILPPIPYITPGVGFFWVQKFAVMKEFGWEAYSYVSFFPRVTTAIVTSDVDMIKEFTNSRHRYPKPVEFYELLGVYGKNLLVTEGPEWSIHRKIANPTFSERNLRFVWGESVRLVEELCDTWGLGDVVKVDNITDVTKKFALFVIANAGFGSRCSWEEDPTDSTTKDDQMSFIQSLQAVAKDVLLRVIIPGPIWGSAGERKYHRVAGLAGRGWLGKRIQNTAISFSELRRHMMEMVEGRRLNGQAGDEDENPDLFSNLLRASEAEKDSSGSKAGLTEDELLGNIFIFFIAGHETTAHTLAFTLGLLALHPEVQERVYQSIGDILGQPGSSRQPLYEDIASFKLVLGTFYEALRLFPAVTAIPKRAATDSIITVQSCDGENIRSQKITLPAGANIFIDVPGVHYNPRYWEDPWTFKPERFLKEWPRDAFLGFSAGARSCIGRKFAETEAIALLVLVLTRYQVRIDKSTFPDIHGETPEARRDRFMITSTGLTLTPPHFPLLFARR